MTKVITLAFLLGVALLGAVGCGPSEDDLVAATQTAVAMYTPTPAPTPEPIATPLPPTATPTPIVGTTGRLRPEYTQQGQARVIAAPQGNTQGLLPLPAILPPLPTRTPGPAPVVPTRTPASAPQPVVHGARPVSATSFLDGLSATDRSCLGPGILTDEDVIAAVAVKPDGEKLARERLDCINGDEAKFQLYMLKVRHEGEEEGEGDEELTEATHRCIFNAFQLSDSALPEPQPGVEPSMDEAMMVFGKVLMVLVTVPLYCAATEQPELLEMPELGSDDELNPDDIVCVVDGLGGVRRWVELIFGDGEVFGQELDRVEGTCGADLGFDEDI